MVTKYRIFRVVGNNQFIQIAEVDSTKRQYIDLTTIISDKPEPNQTYADYYVRAVYQPSGNAPISVSTASNTIRYDIEDGIAAEKLAMNSPDIITEYRLEQNYPNPFNPSTTIEFSLPEKSEVVLSIYNSLGEKIREIVNGSMEAGYQRVVFDARELPSGTYVYQINAKGSTKSFIQSKKMTLVK